MFKQVLTKLSDSIVSGAGTYVRKKFSPAANRERAQEFLIENIRNLGARAPILSAVTGALADNLASIAALDKLHDQQIDKFLKSDKSAEMRSTVAAAQGPKATDRTVEREITKILTNIHKLTNKSTDSQLKESEFYKKNEKFYEQYQRTLLDNLKKKTSLESTSARSTKDTTINKEFSSSEQKLDEISANTNRTVNLLETIHDKSIASIETTTQPAPVKEAPNTVVGAAQTIGANFLGKVFDDTVVEKFASQVKSFFGTGTTESATPANSVVVDNSLAAKVKAESATKETNGENAAATETVESKKISVQEEIATAVVELNKLEQTRERQEKTVAKVDNNTVSKNNTAESSNTITANKNTTVSDVTQASTNSQSVDSAESQVVKKLSGGNLPGYTETLRTALKKKKPAVLVAPNRSKYNQAKQILDSFRSGTPPATQSSESDKETNVAVAKTTGQQTNLLENILEELKKLTTAADKKDTVTGPEKSGRSLIENAIDKLGDAASGGNSRPGQKTGKPIAGTVGKAASAFKNKLGSVLAAGGRAASYIPSIARGTAAASTGGIAALSSTVPLTTAAATTGLLGTAATGGTAAVIGGLAAKGALATTGGGVLGGLAAAAGTVKAAGAAAAAGAIGAAGVGAAGAAGYGIGKYAINPLINSGITAATGKENTLGGWIYDKMNPTADFDTQSPTKTKTVEVQKSINTQNTNKSSSAQKAWISDQASEKKTQVTGSLIAGRGSQLTAAVAAAGTIETQKKSPAAALDKLSEVKERQEAKAAVKASQPIVINNTTSSPNSAVAQQQPGMIVASNVRNADSTFERVQMQDFWPRVK